MLPKTEVCKKYQQGLCRLNNCPFLHTKGGLNRNPFGGTIGAGSAAVAATAAPTLSQSGSAWGSTPFAPNVGGLFGTGINLSFGSNVSGAQPFATDAAASEAQPFGSGLFGSQPFGSTSGAAQPFGTTAGTQPFGIAPKPFASPANTESLASANVGAQLAEPSQSATTNKAGNLFGIGPSPQSQAFGTSSAHFGTSFGSTSSVFGTSIFFSPQPFTFGQSTPSSLPTGSNVFGETAAVLATNTAAASATTADEKQNSAPAIGIEAKTSPTLPLSPLPGVKKDEAVPAVPAMALTKADSRRQSVGRETQGKILGQAEQEKKQTSVARGKKAMEECSVFRVSLEALLSMPVATTPESTYESCTLQYKQSEFVPGHVPELAPDLVV